MGDPRPFTTHFVCARAWEVSRKCVIANNKHPNVRLYTTLQFRLMQADIIDTFIITHNTMHRDCVQQSIRFIPCTSERMRRYYPLSVIVCCRCCCRSTLRRLQFLCRVENPSLSDTQNRSNSPGAGFRCVHYLHSSFSSKVYITHKKAQCQKYHADALACVRNVRV